MPSAGFNANRHKQPLPTPDAVEVLPRCLSDSDKFSGLSNDIIRHFGMLLSASPSTAEHCIRVSNSAEALARALGCSEDEVLIVKLGCLIHDIGKIKIPESILNNNSGLTPEDWSTLEKHPKIGDDIVSQVASLQVLRPIILLHHERLDGSGYPLGLKAENIPLQVRICSVVDTWDALTHDRPYQKKHSIEASISIMRALAGDKLDPMVVEAFLENIAALEEAA